MGKVADAVKNKDFSAMDLGSSQLDFNIEKGRLRFEPMSVTVGGAKGTIKGHTGILDETLDLVLDLEVPLSKIGAGDLISKAGLGTEGTGRLKVLIGGTFDQPTVKVDLGKLTDKLEDTLQAGLEAGKAAAKEAGDKLVKEANQAAKKLDKEADQKATALLDKAKKQSDQILADAGAKAKLK